MRILSTLSVFLLIAPGLVCAEDEKKTVVESTGTAKAAVPRTVDEIYRGAKYRTPFEEPTAARGGGGSGGGGSVSAALKDWDPADFDIHELDLKGILQDKKGSFAILKDRASGIGFILRGGKLFNFKGKSISDVTGKVNTAQKTVYLITSEKDVQTLRLGKDDEEDDEDDEDEEKDDSAQSGAGRASF